MPANCRVTGIVKLSSSVDMLPKVTKPCPSKGFLSPGRLFYLCRPVSGFAAFFLEQLDALDTHAAIDRLAHVVHREQADAHRSQRLHFNAGTADRLHRGAAVHRRSLAVDRKLDIDAGQRKRMAERDQLGSAFCRLNCGDARHAQHVALLRHAAADLLQRCRQHADAPARDCNAARFVFSRNADHVRLPACVKVCEPVPWF
jgi:ribosomal protein S27E